jgi:hypothetical protein
MKDSIAILYEVLEQQISYRDGLIRARIDQKGLDTAARRATIP